LFTSIVLPVTVLERVAHLARDLGPGLVVLSLLVLFHEFGHFVVAKRLGVPVNRFSLGFGPRLFGIKLGETDYCVSLFPLGGYVSMASEVAGPDGQPVAVDHFTQQEWWKRAVIAVAGPGANLLAGYVAMVAVGLVGVTYDDYRAEIGPVIPGSIAEQLGFARGERLVAVDDHPVSTWKGFYDAVSEGEKDAAVQVTTTDSAETKTIVVPAAQRDSVLNSVSPRIDPVVGTVAVGLPAYPAGLRQGDRIESVNGKPVSMWEDLTEVIHHSPEIPVTLGVRRGTYRFEVKVKPTAQSVGGTTIGVIGITPPRQATYVVRAKPVEAFRAAFPLVGHLVQQTFGGLWMLASRPNQAKDQMGGPLLIMRMSSQQAQRGTADFLFLMGVISIAIMAFNLLPLPILDGGHFMLAILEGVRRKPLAQGFLTAYQRLGLALIGSLLVFILFNDVWREAQRDRAVSRSERSEPRAKDAGR
jgi:regulator of sigma E protease